jgi:DNA polymerase-3 subunit delta
MSDLDPLLAAIAAGKGSPVYLLVGEEFLVHQAAEALVAKLVPKAMQGLNLTVMDAASPGEIARDLATLPMFRGSKVVWVREPEFLLPKKGRGDALSKAREAWVGGRRKDGARRVLAIASRAGWTAAQLDPTTSGGVTAAMWKDELEIDLADADLTFLAEVGRFCLDEGIRAPDGDAGALEALLQAGFPKGHHLVIEASTVDARGALYKKLCAAGELVTRKVERELRKLDIHEQVVGALAPLKKKMGREAEDLLKSLTGGNMRLLQSELEKLALYVGARATIEVDDVRLLVKRAREEEYTELANAVQGRDARAALAYAQEAMGQGSHALQILGALVNLVRRLLEDKERYRRLKLAPRLNYRDFQEDVYGLLQEEAKATGKKLPHAYVAYLGFQAQGRFAREELIALLLACGEADLELKSSGNPRLVLERVLLRLQPPS